MEGSKGRSLNFQSDGPDTLEKLKNYLRKSNLFILPLKPDSPLFGTEALSAVAAGVPILVSSHSGMASILKVITQDDSIVRESSLESDEELWKDKIIQKLLKPQDSQKTANMLKEELLLNTTIAQTHLDFIGIIAETSCVRLTVELNTDSAVPPKHIDSALKFGIHLGNRDTPIDSKKYVLAFIQKLLLQREKLDLGLMTRYLESGIATMWQEVLSTLENSKRKLLGIQSGSLIFTLFCPTISSARELKDDAWITSLILNMENFMREIGVEPHLKIQFSDEVLLTETDLLPKLREMMFRQTAQSEGYETMTQHSSDVISEIFYEQSKVMEWLEQQPDTSSQPDTEDTSALNLIETITVSHVVQGPLAKIKFTMSELSGSVAVVSKEGQPSLSVFYPDTDKPPLKLSNEGRSSLPLMYPGPHKPSFIWPKHHKYESALFITIAGKEYLAASSAGSIHLWNLQNNRSGVAYILNEKKPVNLCLIDEKNVASAETSSSHGFGKICFLSTEREKWKLNRTYFILLDSSVHDICHVKTSDGTQCFILNQSVNGLVQSVEMVSGKVKWQVDRQQMGRSFNPQSICSDGSTVFVVSVSDSKLYLLSVEDGVPQMEIALHPFGIHRPNCVRLKGEHLYVGYLNQKGTYCINKFIKSQG